MRPTQVSLAAVGISSPIRHDYYQTPPAITLALLFSSGAVATASVLYTVDPLDSGYARQVYGVSQTTTVITVTNDPGPLRNNGTHGLSVGDMVQVIGSGGIDGWYPVASVVSAISYTLTSPVSTSFTAPPSTQVISARVFTHSTLTALTARATGNYAFPVMASMLNVTAWTSGTVTLEAVQGGLSS